MRTLLSLMMMVGLTGLQAGWPHDVGAAPFAYVTNSGDDTVSVIDTDTNILIATVPVGQSPFSVAVDPRGIRVYVTNMGDRTVSVIDATRNVVEATVKAGGFGVAVNPAGTSAYAVGTGADGVVVSVIDTATNVVTTTIPIGPTGPGDNVLELAVAPDGTVAYLFTTLNTEQYPCLIDRLGCRLVFNAIDLTTNTPSVSRPLLEQIGGSPRGLTVDPSGTHLYLAHDTPSGGALSIFVAQSPTLSSSVPLIGPVGVAQRGNRLYATSLDGLSVIDLVTNTIVASIGARNSLAGVAVTPDGKRVYVANGADNAVWAVDTATNTVVETIPVGRGPVAFGQFIGPANPPFTPLPTQSPTPTRTPAPCAGDCDGDGSVTVDELLKGVNIALGKLSVDHCDSLDSDHDGTVTVDEIVSAVANALNGCT